MGSPSMSLRTCPSQKRTRCTAFLTTVHSQPGRLWLDGNCHWDSKMKQIGCTTQSPLPPCKQKLDTPLSLYQPVRFAFFLTLVLVSPFGRCASGTVRFAHLPRSGCFC